MENRWPWISTRANYNRLSSFYDLFAHGSERNFIKEGLHILDVKEGWRILEIGTGTGHAALDLAQSVGYRSQIWGIDLADRMIRISSTRLKTSRVSDRVHLQVGDAAALPYGCGSFDAIFMSFTYELFEDQIRAQVLQECRRVIKSGGLVCIVGLNKEQPQNLMTRLYEIAHQAFPRVIDCRPVAIKEEVAANGFIPILEIRKKMFGLPVGIVLALRAVET